MYDVRVQPIWSQNSKVTEKKKKIVINPQAYFYIN